MKKFNTNYIALAVLLIAFGLSTARYLSVSAKLNAGDESASGEASSGAVITIAHWQLEPGFREGLDWAIEQYQALPKVKEAGITVKQIAVPDRVYNQFMNVQLIAGTATDIAQYGQTRLVQGTSVAKFYAGIDDYINEPNPYNQAPYLKGQLAPETVASLADSSWKNTFVDGMASSHDAGIDGYFSIRLSNFGQARFFYNTTILHDVKAFLKAAIEANPEPGWLRDCWFRSEDGIDYGYLNRSPDLDAWLADTHAPETLGQLMLYCEAVKAYALANDRPFLIPISGSSYGPSDLSTQYERIFMASLRESLDVDSYPGVSVLEGLAGFEKGRYSLESKAVREFFRFAQDYSSFFPSGYLGLDREQAMRRFVLGSAAILSAGAWDSGSIIYGVQSRDNPEDIFELEITAPPMPTEDERWGDLIKKQISEMSETMPGAGFALNKQSKHFEWALDFLRFATSIPINEGINQRTGWLPSVVEAKPNEALKAFTPVAEGYPPAWAFSIGGQKASMKNQWSGQSKLLISKSIDYGTFSANIKRSFEDPRQGIPSHWFTEWQKRRDRTRAADRTLSLERFRILFDEDPANASKRERALYTTALADDEGVSALLYWQQEFPDRPFPKP